MGPGRTKGVPRQGKLSKLLSQLVEYTEELYQVVKNEKVNAGLLGRQSIKKHV